jgi:tRNA dimethylallyltransferase
MKPASRRETDVLVVLGPTGTGKTALAVELARALGGEIVGCDALQVYRGFDAATAKPSAAEREVVRHHLVDCVDPRTDYTMADYVEAADVALTDLAGRGRVPLVVGGSGMYLRGLLRGYVEAPPRDPALRARLRRIVERGGAERLRAWLARWDPASAARIPASDVQRLVRAIEVTRTGETTWSQRLSGAGSWASSEERWRALKIGLDLERELHGAHLDTRVDGFFDAGLVEEIRSLLAQGIPREANAFKAIGYREVLRAIERGEDPEQTREEVRRNTRRLAKRQRSWFRTEPKVVWLDAADDRAQLVERVVDLWRRHVASGRA